MLSFNIIAASAAALTLVSAAPIQPRGTPAGWASSYLESYDVYHLRYLALDCQSQHNSTFFEDCCHPLLASEDLSSRETYCTPNSTQIASASSYIAYTATATASDVSVTATGSATTTAADEEASEYCSDEASVASYVSSAVAQATGTVSEVVYTSDSKTQTINVAAAVATDAAPSSSSVYVAPTTSSTEVYVAPTTTSTTPAAATTTASSDSGNWNYGDATYFYQNGNAGACGNVNSDSTPLIAINAQGYWADYASNSQNSNCGRYVNIVRVSTGASVQAIVADVCPTCSGTQSIDLSVGAFTAIASEGEGMVAIKWEFI